MKRNVRPFFVAAALGLSLLACQLPFSPEATQSAQAPLAQPAFSGGAGATLPAISTPQGGAVATLPPTYTPVPTLKGADATQAARLLQTATLQTADLSAVKIQLQDLPVEFQELDAASQQQIGLTQASLASYFEGTFSQARATNYFAFVNAKAESFEVVLGLLFSPLSAAEKASFDKELSDPSLAMQTFSAAFGGAAEVIQGSDQVGEKSAGFTFLSQSGALSMRGDLYLARRQGVAQLVLVLYQDGKQPPMPAAALSALLDARLKAVVNP